MTKAEEIAKKWGILHYESGEVNKDVLEALNEALHQPPVISSVCDCEAHTFYEWEKDENKCSQCNKRIYKQTDL